MERVGGGAETGRVLSRATTTLSTRISHMTFPTTVFETVLFRPLKAVLQPVVRFK